MPEYLSPGVYVEEVPSGPRPIEGVSTSTAGMVGLTERGPTRARLVTSWGDFQSWYGGIIEPATSFAPFAARGFFDNGGQRLFMARVTRDDAVAASLTSFSSGSRRADRGDGYISVGGTALVCFSALIIRPAAARRTRSRFLRCVPVRLRLRAHPESRLRRARPAHRVCRQSSSSVDTAK